MANPALPRILVVDDHEGVRKALCRLVSTEFEVVCESASGEDAVLRAAEHWPDVVLLDISLPGISGFEVAEQIRALSPKSKILFVSQHDAKEVVGKAFLAGGHGYLVKSLAGHSLIEAIKIVLRGERFVSDSLEVSAFDLTPDYGCR